MHSTILIYWHVSASIEVAHWHTAKCLESCQYQSAHGAFAGMHPWRTQTESWCLEGCLWISASVLLPATNRYLQRHHTHPPNSAHSTPIKGSATEHLGKAISKGLRQTHTHRHPYHSASTLKQGLVPCRGQYRESSLPFEQWSTLQEQHVTFRLG